MTQSDSRFAIDRPIFDEQDDLDDNAALRRFRSKDTRTKLQLWWIRPVDEKLRIDDSQGHLFAGDEESMVRHINKLHQATGTAQAAHPLEN